MKKTIKFILIYIVIFLNIFGVNKKEVEIIDNVGRKITLKVPVEKAVVALKYNNELIRACNAIDQVVAVDMDTAQDRQYWHNFSMENVIGKNQNNLNYKKIIKLKPDVLILPENGDYLEAEKKLSPFGIAVVVISGYDSNDFHKQINNIGIIFGKEKEAKEFIEFYEKPLKYIKEMLIGIEKKKIYWEESKDYSIPKSTSCYYSMIDSAGGKNIFSKDIILENPDIIVKNINFTNKNSVNDKFIQEDILMKLGTIKNRPGWEGIDAVKNNRVYLMNSSGHGAAFKLIGAVYMAKWMYPDILKELDPDKVFKEWLEKYQQFKYIDGYFYPKEKLK